MGCSRVRQAAGAQTFGATIRASRDVADRMCTGPLSRHNLAMREPFGRAPGKETHFSVICAPQARSRAHAVGFRLPRRLSRL